jgi:hypothetical protein
VTRHFTFRAHALDLGYYVQLTWNLARGRGPYVSPPEMHAWDDHLSPIVYLFVPAFWLMPRPTVLLVGQSVLLALGALPVFGIARHRFQDERPAAALAILYLLNPSLHGMNVRDFHAAALAIPLLLAAIYFAEVGRPGLFVVAAVLTLACREDAALPVMGLGVWLALSRRRWLAGGATALGALTLLVAGIRWIIPSFRHEPYVHLWRYAHLGQFLGEIILTHPVRTVGGLLTAGASCILWRCWHCLACCRSWARGIGLARCQRSPRTCNHRTQYQAFVLPFLILATIAGYSRLAAEGSTMACRCPGRSLHGKLGARVVAGQ